MVSSLLDIYIAIRYRYHKDWVVIL